MVCEPAILIRRRGPAVASRRQIWSLPRLEHKLIHMRELYEEHMEHTTTTPDTNMTASTSSDPFLETNEAHSLVGVANVYLDVLFHDMLELDYLTPIVSQQGEVAGRLRVQLRRVAGRLPRDRLGQCEALSEGSGGGGQRRDEEEDEDNLFTFSLSIKEAVGIPAAYSQFVFCEYSTWWAGEGGGEEAESVVVPPICDPAVGVQSLAAASNGVQAASFRFNHSREWTVLLTEDFLDFCSDGALSIEVYGHKLDSPEEVGGEAHNHWAASQATRARSLADRWQELTRKLELRVDIQELNEEGEYVPVEVVEEADSGGAGGVFQLRQGQQRRLGVVVQPLSMGEGGMLPLICESLVEVAVGSPCLRSRLQRPLDSYQEEDLTRLRGRWTEALDRRRQYLDGQMKQYLDKVDKTETEAEREQSLVEQWVHLTEERNAVLAPAEHSGVPGAPTPSERVPVLGAELHHPVLFLDLQPGDLAADDDMPQFIDDEDEDTTIPLFCHQSILPKEHGGKFYSLPIVRQLEQDTAVVAVASWDSSIHDSIYLNRLTEPSERAYLIVKAVVRLSHPQHMDLMLRKRICFNVYKQQRSSLSDRIRRRLAGVAAATVSAAGIGQGTVSSVGVTYELVAHVPTASEELEARESLAIMAASSSNNNAAQDLQALADGETFIEKYTRAAAAVEELLRLDKLRQQMAVRELLVRANKEACGGRGRPLSGRQSMRKTFSVPNFRHMMKSSMSLDSLASLRSPLQPSDSFQDLKGDIANLTVSRQGTDYGLQAQNGQTDEGDVAMSRYGTSAACPLRRLPMSLTMSTLHEERSSSRLVEEASPEELAIPRDKQLAEVSSAQILCSGTSPLSVAGECHRTNFSPTAMTKSQTAESLTDLNQQKQQQPPPKNGSPSLLSSGYESQAVSLTTLSSEDSLSVRSMSVEDENQEGESDIGRLSDLTAEVSLRHTNHRSSFIADDRSLVVTRRNGALRNWNKQQQHQMHRLSCPSSLLSLDHHNATTSITSNSRAKQHIDNTTASQNCHSSAEGINNLNNNCSRVEDDEEELASGRPHSASLPDWLVVGESVQVRPSNLSGVVCFVGPTQFAPGLWVGVELDTSRGKNDGCVDGVRYFTCLARRGMFVRPKSLKLDRRGREMRAVRVASDSPASRTTVSSPRGVVKSKSRQSLTLNPGCKSSGLF